MISSYLLQTCLCAGDPGSRETSTGRVDRQRPAPVSVLAWKQREPQQPHQESPTHCYQVHTHMPTNAHTHSICRNEALYQFRQNTVVIVPSYSHTNHNPFAQKVGLFEYDSPLTDPCYTNAATHCCQKPEHFRSWKVSKEICVKICIDSIHVNYVYRHFHQEESLSSDFGKSSCQGNLVHLHVLIKILIYGISECAIYHGVSIFCPTSLWLRVWKWYSVSRSGLTLVYPRDFLHYAPCFGLAFCIANPGIVELSAPAWTYFHSLH